jgi:hypothetical protein
MLGRFRRPQANVGASYAVVWANLRKRYPRLRTILVTGASGRGDATVVAVGLADAAVNLDRSPEKRARRQLRSANVPLASANDTPPPIGNPAPLTLATSVAEHSSRVLVIVLDSAKGDRNPLESPVPSVRIIEAPSPAQVRTALSASGDFAFVIVVAPAPQEGPDCISLADSADVVILVARLGRTRFGDAQLAARLLRQVGEGPAAALLLTKQLLRSRTAVQPDASPASGHGQRIGSRKRPVPPEPAG